MKVKVTRKFRDKNTGVIHPRGAELEMSEERYNEIMSAGDYVYKIPENAPETAANNETANTPPKAKKAVKTANEAPADGFDIMSVSELKDYADKVHKMTFGRGAKRAEIVETLRRLEQDGK